MNIKLVDDLFKGSDGRWKGEKIWATIALTVFHGGAFVQRNNLDLQDYAIAVGILHGVLFTANGLKTFLEKKVPSINIDSKETNVSAP